MAKNITKTLKLATVIDDCKSYSYNCVKDLYEKYQSTFEYKYLECKDLDIGYYANDYVKSHKVVGLDVERHDEKVVCVFLYKVSVPETVFMEYGNVWCTESDALRSDVISRVIGGENTYEATFINPDNMKLAQLDITTKDEATAKKEAKAHAKSNGLMLVKVEIKPTTENGNENLSTARRYGMKHETFVSLAAAYGTIERL